ncbi:MAG TPA: hypothetical protein VMT20_05275 [Terriglobia bacterium]|nr:hypothetical protein [Terriglobia bacterium]
MRPRPLRAFLLVAVCAARLGAQGRSVTFSGEAAEGQTYRKQISHGLDFVLSPDTMGAGITGWTIEVSPHIPPSEPQCGDFTWVVTPPYRFQNVRYLDTSYATTAQDAVRVSPRDFKFVLNCDDFKVERKRVNLVLWSYTYPKSEVDQALAKLGSSPSGTGRLWIEDYKITPGKRTADGVDLGEIHWIKFRVEIRFPGNDGPKPTGP